MQWDTKVYLSQPYTLKICQKLRFSLYCSTIAYELKTTTHLRAKQKRIIGHFPVVLCLCIKTSLHAKLFMWKCFSLQVHFHANQTHMKGFAQRLALKQRHKVSWKCPICSVLYLVLVKQRNRKLKTTRNVGRKLRTRTYSQCIHIKTTSVHRTVHGCI